MMPTPQETLNELQSCLRRLAQHPIKHDVYTARIKKANKALNVQKSSEAILRGHDKPYRRIIHDMKKDLAQLPIVAPAGRVSYPGLFKPVNIPAPTAEDIEKLTARLPQIPHFFPGTRYEFEARIHDEFVVHDMFRKIFDSRTWRDHAHDQAIRRQRTSEMLYEHARRARDNMAKRPERAEGFMEAYRSYMQDATEEAELARAYLFSIIGAPRSDE